MANYNYDGSLGGVQIILSYDEVEQILEDYIYNQYGLSTAGPIECCDGEVKWFVSEFRIKCIQPTGDNER